jgi:hypothetical protein
MAASRPQHSTTPALSTPDPSRSAVRAPSAPAAPAGSFADLGVPAALCRVLAAAGITHPFPIQSATMATRSPGATCSAAAVRARARRSPSCSRSSPGSRRPAGPASRSGRAR